MKSTFVMSSAHNSSELRTTSITKRYTALRDTNVSIQNSEDTETTNMAHSHQSNDIADASHLDTILEESLRNTYSGSLSSMELLGRDDPQLLM